MESSGASRSSRQARPRFAPAMTRGERQPPWVDVAKWQPWTAISNARNSTLASTSATAGLGVIDAVSGRVLQAMGNVHLLKGAYSSAETLFLQAVPLCHTTNNFERLALCLRGLACVAAERRRWARAARLLGAGDRVISGATRVAQLDLYIRAADAARAHLGASGFARAYAEGLGYQLRDLLAEIETR